jgi:predicted dehydrogenase
VAEARELVALAARHRAPVFSSSALRYAPDVLKLLADEKLGRALGAVCYGPAPLAEPADGKVRNPGLFHYGIHAAEMLYTVMGPGCAQVSCIHEDGVDIVTGRWRDGRLGTVRGIRQGERVYGLLLFGEKGVVHRRVQAGPVYRELLRRVVGFFESHTSPVPVVETVELMAFLEAALVSAGNGGSAVSLTG